MQTLIIHGRQPALGRAELESLYGAKKIRPVGDKATVLDLEPVEVDFSRLGGMVKFCKVLTDLDTTDWKKVEKFLIQTTPQHFQYLPLGKLKIGLSAYGVDANPKQIQATALKLKKAGKEAGRSIRIIPNKAEALNSATVLYNKLTQKLGWELVFVRDGNKIIVAQSIAVQDIDKYAARDQDRPYRDTRVGMLPPKLAQIIINLAKPPNNGIILDPFCGTGVILQEALLMGYGFVGSDLEKRMAEYSEGNINWLYSQYQSRLAGPICAHVMKADATSEQWDHRFDTIASETYLGRPFSALPDLSTLKETIGNTAMINRQFLQNIASQTKPGFRICIAVPAWSVEGRFERLPTLEKLDKLGYNRVSFVHAGDEELIYHRPGQIVARELVVLERK